MVPQAMEFATLGRGELRELEEVFSVDEVKLLLRFCAEIKLDYGEIDVLRDSDDGHIYIVDVKTPFGPSNRRLDDSPWFDRISWVSLEKMCHAFEKAFATNNAIERQYPLSGPLLRSE